MIKTRFTTSFCSEISHYVEIGQFFQRFIKFITLVEKAAELVKEDFLVWNLHFSDINHENCLRVQMSVERCEQVGVPLAIRSLTESNAHYSLRVKNSELALIFLLDDSTLQQESDFLSEKMATDLGNKLAQNIKS